MYPAGLASANRERNQTSDSQIGCLRNSGRGRVEGPSGRVSVGLGSRREWGLGLVGSLAGVASRPVRLSFITNRWKESEERSRSFDERADV